MDKFRVTRTFTASVEVEALTTLDAIKKTGWAKAIAAPGGVLFKQTDVEVTPIVVFDNAELRRLDGVKEDRDDG